MNTVLEDSEERYFENPVYDQSSPKVVHDHSEQGIYHSINLSSQESNGRQTNVTADSHTRSMGQDEGTEIY